MYERDRQPVARQNAALSVRNYRRVLNIMRACYLDDRHPAFLIQALDATASFVPLEMRRITFRTMLQTALSPLSQLQKSPNGVYALAIKDNLRILLGSGQGLPLLFPKHELDFSYNEHSIKVKNEASLPRGKDEWSQDSVATSPRLALGELFPHIVGSVHLETLRRFPRLQRIDDIGDDRPIKLSVRAPSRPVSTRDLAAQLATDEIPCAFCLLEIVVSTDASTNNNGGNCTDDALSHAQITLQRTFGLPFLSSRLTVSSKCDVAMERFIQLNNEDTGNLPVCNICVDRQQWGDLHLFSESTERRDNNYFVVIRPDGHVAAISPKGMHIENLCSGIRTTLMGE